MIKKLVSIVLSVVLIIAAFSGCTSKSSADVMDDALDMLNDDYNDYKNSNGHISQDVQEALDTLLENYVSGIAEPKTQKPHPIDSDSAKKIISKHNDVVHNETELFNTLYDAIKNVETSLTFEADEKWCNADLITETVLEDIYNVYMIDAFGLNEIGVSYIESSVNGNTVYIVTYGYLNDHTTEQISSMRQELRDEAQKVTSSLNISQKSDYQKIVAIDDYLCDTVYYPDEPYISYDYIPYGALIDGRAVCDGYARATKILCDYVDLECIYVHGYCGDNPDEGGHAWNLVKIDGSYYQLDVTWNDAGGNKDYFLVTDSFMRNSRHWEEDNYPKTANRNYQP